jgi:multicomponent Na+:H+ antiporter subunit A
VLPATSLALLGLVGGLAAGTVDRWLAPYADTHPDPAAGPTYHLALWHGLEPALAWSAVSLVAGLALFLLREPVARAQAGLPAVADADRAYRRLMRALDTTAVSLTVRTQVGSLPVYLAVALCVVVAAVGGALWNVSPWSVPWHWWDHPAQGVLAVAIIVAAVAVTRATRRFAAVVIVGVVGYAVGVVFATHGAPDLALTQILVESITLVAFVLVLRRLPVRIGEMHGSTHRGLRAALAVAVGVVMMAVTAAATAVRDGAPVSTLWPGPALEFGGGQNLVNVALVDIRAWDTVGEISVLVVAATGVASLIFIRRRTGSAPRMELRPKPGSALSRYAPVQETVAVHAADPRADDEDPSNDDRPPTSSSWLLAGRTLAPENRSIILEVVVRLLFHAAVVLSLFLLFSGHNNPGGGFAGGLVVGLALIARYLAGGRYELGEAVPVDAGVVLGAGMLLATGTALGGLLFGGEVFQSAILEWDMPVFGHVKLVTSLFFDIGVYLVVIGVLLDVLRSLGAEVDRQGEAADPPVGHGEGTTVSEPRAEVEHR